MRCHDTVLRRDADEVRSGHVQGSSPMSLTVVGAALIACGLVYVTKPNLFRRGLWMKTSIAVRSLSEDGYRRYMRGLGAAFIVTGAGCIAWGLGLDGLFGQG
jgi:hypothetical protein